MDPAYIAQSKRNGKRSSKCKTCNVELTTAECEGGCTVSKTTGCLEGSNNNKIQCSKMLKNCVFRYTTLPMKVTCF
ncbi:unnamed protein product, partial [Dicrocoelium dendriticum]